MKQEHIAGSEQKKSSLLDTIIVVDRLVGGDGRGPIGSSAILLTSAHALLSICHETTPLQVSMSTTSPSELFNSLVRL